MRTSALLVIASLAWPCVSRAQTEPPPFAPPVEAEPVAPGEVAGREATLRGRVLFDAGDFRGAALEYEQAVQVLPVGRRRNAALNNLAVCYERLHAYDEALAAYERYLREADPTPEDRAEVERIVRGVRDLLAELSVTSDTPARVWVDERERGETPLHLKLTAGQHVIELRAEGHRSERRSISLRARSLEDLHVALAPEERYRGVHRAYVYSGIGLTAVALLTGAGLGIRALRVHGDAQTRADEKIATVDDEAQIRRLALAADIAFGSAALFGASSLVLGFLTDWKSELPARASLGVAPLARERGALFVLGGVL